MASALGARMPSAVKLLATGAVVGIAAWAGIEVTQACGRVAAIWPANAILLGLLLITRRPLWLPYLIAGFLGNVAGNLLAHEAWSIAALLSLCNLLEVAVAALALRRFVGPRPEITQARAFIAFLLWGGLLAPLASATAAAAVMAGINADPYLIVLRNWYLADALGLIIFTPPLLLLWTRTPPETESGYDVSWSVGIYTMVVITALAVFAQGHSAPLLLIYLPLLLATFRHGYFGAVYSVLLLCMVSVALTAIGSGPFAQLPDLSIGDHILLLQGFLAITLFTVLPAGMLLERKRDLERQLGSLEERYRLVADASSEMVALIDADLRLTFASPAARVVRRCPPEALLGRSFLDGAHPEDVDALLAALRSLEQVGSSATVLFRETFSDGSILWCEARLQRLANPRTAQAGGYLVTLRDISARKVTEARLEEAHRRIEAMATIDGLTGVANRRRFDETLETEWRRGARKGEPLALILIDIDDFKALNDYYGHQAGDECLQKVAAVLRGSVRRQADLTARYGVSEFAVVLPHTEIAGARFVAEQIVQSIRDLGIRHAGGTSGNLSVSVGVACLVPQTPQPCAELVDVAYRALLRARQNGGNTIKTGQREEPYTSPAPSPRPSDAIVGTMQTSQ